MLGVFGLYALLTLCISDLAAQSGVPKLLKGNNCQT